ncbi:hypothetical protein BS639_08590 [Rouxiella silvae]|uniref:Chitin-binding protein n=1 Tax=Rouxiella silvae TaxID=1646373 RepID=A0ABX3U2J4_9GAMM|nr:lytic polysaccharide monooxygenase [Rouxiella silvae]ORJ21686.1 hypothetical protein BS639_08590 [Rouxiella silvae]
MKFSKSILSLAVAMTLPAALLMPTTAQAHGYISTPTARHVLCNREGQASTSEGCKAARAHGSNGFTEAGGHTNVGSTNYMNQIQDGAVCSSNYRGINVGVPKGDWPISPLKVNADGSVDLSYKYTAVHGTDHIAFYITKSEYNPANPLKWSDLELLGRRDGDARPANAPNAPDSNNETHFNFKLPSQQAGRHVIFAAWPVSKNHGTGEVFTTCADVEITNNGVSTPGWERVGDGIKANEKIIAGTTVRFRLFDSMKAGSVAFDTAYTASNNMDKKDWLYKLAKQINTETNLAKVGTLKNNEVTLGAAATYYDVYTKSSHKYSSAVYLEAAEDDDQPVKPPVNHDQAFLNGLNFTVTPTVNPNKVTFKGIAVSNTQATGNVSYVWTLPNNAQITGEGKGSQSFEIKRNKKEQNLQVSVKVNAGKLSKTLKQSIVVPAKADNDQGNETQYPQYVAGQKYAPGDKVSTNGSNYQCKAVPHGWWCAQPAYNPAGSYGSDAWDKI